MSEQSHISPNEALALHPNKQMLREALESPGIDKELRPLLERFFNLPLTPTESRYGHPDRGRLPYLSFVEDEVHDENKAKMCESFLRECKENLANSINKNLGNQWVAVKTESESFEGGPKMHTVSFFVDPEIYRQHGEEMLTTIWKTVQESLSTHFR